MNRLAHIAGTVCGVGHLKPAPGTWGSAAALPIFWGLHVAGGPWLIALSMVGLFLMGIWATKTMTNGQEDHDPSEIVIDEVVGQMAALFPLSLAATRLDLSVLTFWPGWISAFLLFRMFDILKPGPVGWADRRDDAIGVMLDDVIAGLLAAFGVLALAAFAHGLLR